MPQFLLLLTIALRFRCSAMFIKELWLSYLGLMNKIRTKANLLHLQQLNYHMQVVPMDLNSPEIKLCEYLSLE